jgi:hypothetical protein
MDKETRLCPHRYKLVLGEKRWISCCFKRHGFMIKSWKCLGRKNERCPLVLEKGTKDV